MGIASLHPSYALDRSVKPGDDSCGWRLGSNHEASSGWFCATGRPRRWATNTKHWDEDLPSVIASYSFLSAAAVDCFAQSSARSRARLARNDEPRNAPCQPVLSQASCAAGQPRRRVTQDEGRGGCRFDQNFGNAGPAEGAAPNAWTSSRAACEPVAAMMRRCR
jgi:hypothetical protein